MILVVTRRGDPTADLVVAGLEHFGARWARFNQGLFPERTELALDPARPEAGVLVDEAGARIPLGEVRVVWIWHPRACLPAPDLDAAQARFVTSASQRTCQALLHQLARCCCMVNPPAAEARAEDKALQLRAAVDQGFRIPETLVTNSPERARAFCARFRQTLFKQVSAPRVDYGDRAFWFAASVLEPDDLAALDQLRHCPGIFQRRIPKRHDLRVTVVGDRLFPVAIHSQEDPRGAVDFRLALAADPQALRHEPVELPEPVRRRTLALVRRLGLVYAALDLAVTPEGDYVFLEVNPSGQYAWIERRTGLPITRELVRLLIRADRAGARAGRWYHDPVPNPLERP